MEKSKYLYIMLSRTCTGMGKIIRTFTRNEYNHVSLTLDASFKRFVSFARYRQDVALAGGFIEETPQRFLSAGQPVPIRMYRLEISTQRHNYLENLFSAAGNNNHLIYNSLGALLSTWGIRCHIPGTYTCLEFAAVILGTPARTLQELQDFLEPYEIYTGNLSELTQDNGDRSEPYFVRRGLWGGIADTAHHFARLAGRLLRISKCHDSVVTLK